ncbi:hypothetical protein D910_11153 [Dendroctonus ponderosae]|uniref:Uncharacterized protein n=1 Tax=Dendroctonus ponderosae TaxID=77166 RepID=U4UL91_DENPD|nr:hypothetical protein D910_11153 [Dendroctonus ponderosae]
MKPDEMILNKWYKVINIRKINTSFGEAVMVELEEKIIFLPKRLISVMSKSAIDDLLSNNGCFICFKSKKTFPAAAWLRTAGSYSSRSTGGRFSIANPLKHIQLISDQASQLETYA